MVVASTAQYSGPKAAQIIQDAVQLIGLDGTQIRLSQQQSSDRQARLNRNVNNALVHQTGRQGARGIIISGQMNKGASGIAAGGIYFATNGSDTMHKAHYHGFLFTLRVRLGNVEHWSATQTDASVTFESLQRRGYDSVHIPRHGGDEYIVYHSDQVELRTVQLVALPANYPHGRANPGFFQYGTPCMLTGAVFQTSDLRKNQRALDLLLNDPPDAYGAEQLLRGGGHHQGGRPPSAGGGGRGGSHQPVCMFSPNCYRTNQEHWRQYAHPGQQGPAPKPW